MSLRTTSHDKGTFAPYPEVGPSGPTESGLGPTIALTASFCAALIGIVVPAAYTLLPPTELPVAGIFKPPHQSAETLAFLASLAVVVPAALAVVPACARRVTDGPNATALSALAAILSGLLLGAVGAVKASAGLPWGDGLLVIGSVLTLWILVAAGLLVGAGIRSNALLQRLERRAAWIWGANGILALAVVLAFTNIQAMNPVVALVGAFLAGAVTYAYGRIDFSELRKAFGRILDLSASVLLLFAVTNLAIFFPEQAPNNFDAAFETQITQFHQNFFLGPANQILGGGAMLIDTVSQYGVGSIYAITAWFEVAPIGNGTLGLLDGFLSAMVFVAAYLILRASRVSRPLVFLALSVAVIALTWGLIYPLGALLQHGAIRFGMPVVLILAAVAEARWAETGARRRVVLARGVGLAVIGLSSIWALEAFAYTGLVAVAVIGLRIVLAERTSRMRIAGVALAAGVAACVITHAVFAAVTLAATGELPDWREYINYLRAFLGGDVGTFTYDFIPWSAGIPVAILYICSAVALVIGVRWRSRVLLAEPVALVALVGSTAYGVALFSYFVNRSAPHILPYICLPAVMVVALWVSVLLRAGTLSLGSRRGVLAVSTALAVVVVAAAWPQVGKRFSESALAYAAPGGKSLSSGLDRLWNPPPLDPRAPAGEALLEQSMPGQGSAPVIATADLSIETLVRSQRANYFPIGDPWEDSFVPEQRLPDLAASVASLEVGDLMLVDDAAISSFRDLRRMPSVDPLSSGGLQTPETLGTLAPLQFWLLKEIGLRFDLEVVSSEGTFSVVRLMPRKDGGSGAAGVAAGGLQPGSDSLSG